MLYWVGYLLVILEWKQSGLLIMSVSVMKCLDENKQLVQCIAADVVNTYLKVCDCVFDIIYTIQVTMHV